MNGRGEPPRRGDTSRLSLSEFVRGRRSVDIGVCLDATTKNVDEAYFDQPSIPRAPRVTKSDTRRTMTSTRKLIGVDVRIAGTPEQPLFCGKDVCVAAGLTNRSRVLGHLTKEYTQMVRVQTKRGMQTLKFVTESGLFQLLVTSRSTNGRMESFRRWVFEDALPGHPDLVKVLPILPPPEVGSHPPVDGYVYLLESASGTIAKVGRAADCRKRWRSYQCPPNWKPRFAVHVSDQVAAETQLIAFMHTRFQLANGREFFRCYNTHPIMEYMATKFGPNELAFI